MNASAVNTMNYEQKTMNDANKNKPNSNPISSKAKMNVNSLITKDYRKKDDFAVRKNKPNSNPISSKAKMNVNSLITKDYRKKDDFAVQKNKANQTRSEFIPKGAEIPTGELLGILKQGTNFKGKKMPRHGYFALF